MRSTPTIVIASAALVLSGCAVGLLLGRWMLSTPANTEKSASSPAAPVDLDPLVAEIRRSNDLVLEAVRARNGERSDERARPSSERAAATLDPALLDRLVSTLEATNTLLRQGSARGNRLPSSLDALKGAGFPSADALFAWVERARARPEGSEDPTPEIQHLHALWTRDDVLERYGNPSFIGSGERGLTFSYNRTDANGVESSVGFMTAEGLLTEVWVQ